VIGLIPAQGMGVFACRKNNWLGFNPKFRGFGGEEGYIHEKYRKNGKQVICLPFCDGFTDLYDLMAFHIGLLLKIKSRIIL
jgi:hypothetical protein